MVSGKTCFGVGLKASGGEKKQKKDRYDRLHDYLSEADLQSWFHGHHFEREAEASLGASVKKRNDFYETAKLSINAPIKERPKLRIKYSVSGML